MFRLRALRESPTAFGSSFGEESRFPLKVFADRLAPTEAQWAFGAFDGDRLIGFVTLVREARVKERHKASVYAMYVAPAARGHGIGRMLLDRVLETARRVRGLRQVRLAVVEGNGPALRLYQSAGFEIHGREADALRISGRYYAELFLALRVKHSKRPRRKRRPSLS